MGDTDDKENSVEEAAYKKVGLKELLTRERPYENHLEGSYIEEDTYKGARLDELLTRETPKANHLQGSHTDESTYRSLSLGYLWKDIGMRLMLLFPNSLEKERDWCCEHVSVCTHSNTNDGGQQTYQKKIIS